VSVDYQTVDVSATIANNDYVAQSGTISFVPKVASEPITITVNADSTRENFETFRVILSNPVGGTIGGSGIGTGTIRDDDGGPRMYVDDAVVNEEDGTATFRVYTLGQTALSTMMVDYLTMDGTATAPADYVATSGTLSFPPKTDEQYVTVTLRDDLDCEVDQTTQFETFFLRIQFPTGAAIIDNTGQATVHDSMDCRVIPTTLAMFLAEASSEGIELRWQFADPSAFAQIDVERAGAITGPWSVVPATLREEGGVMSALDATVEASQTYWYRLVGRTAQGERAVFGPISATAG
jgi:hypothetical protein